MELKLLTASSFPDKKICSQCKYYKEELVFGSMTQVIDGFCCKCYSDKVFIITRFEKKETR